MFNSRTMMLLISLLTLAGCGDKKIFSELSCAIDSVNDSNDLVVAMKGNSVLKVNGWAADSLSKQAPETITINLVSSAGVVTKFAEGKLTVPRPDVNTALNAPSIANTGFSLSEQLGSPAPGAYEIQILQYFPDRILVCKSAKSIRIN